MKKIKALLIIFFIAIAFCGCHQTNSVDHPKKEINKITIKWVDFDIESVIRIECDQFDDSFGGGSFNVSLSSDKDINCIVKMIKGMKRMDNAYQPDVRGKMLLYHSNNTTDTICFSDIVLKLKNNSYETPPQLIKFLTEKSNQLSKQQKHN